VLAEGPGLVMFDAHYGPGATLDALPTREEDCRVPPNEAPALDQVLGELHLTGDSTEHALRTLRSFFQREFSYRTWQSRDRLTSTNFTPLGQFLLHSRSGHCEYFATASVLLLRRLGIPARYAVGYAVHENAGRKYIVRQRDAHAWCLVWKHTKGIWQDFDTTPAAWIQAEQTRASSLQWLSDLWSAIRFEIAKLRWGQTHLRQYLLWALGPILALLLGQILLRSRRLRRGGKRKEILAPTAWPGLDSEFYQLERKLVARGLARRPSEPLSTWLQRARSEPSLVEISSALPQLLRLHYRYRFDPHGLSRTDREALRLEANTCLALVEKATPS